jgi:hypothetical protein
VAGDDNTAATGGCLLVVEVFGLDAGVAGDLLQGLAVLVFANAANVDDRLGLEDVLYNDALDNAGTSFNMEQIAKESRICSCGTDKKGLVTYRSASRSILRSSTSDQNSVVVLDQVLVKTHMLLRVCENSIISLQAILVK